MLLQRGPHNWKGLEKRGQLIDPSPPMKMLHLTWPCLSAEWQPWVKSDCLPRSRREPTGVPGGSSGRMERGVGRGWSGVGRGGAAVGRGGPAWGAVERGGAGWSGGQTGRGGEQRGADGAGAEGRRASHTAASQTGLVSGILTRVCQAFFGPS